MVAPVRYLSRREQQQKLGILGYTEQDKVLEVIGRVGIGTTIFDADYNLDVRGNARITDLLVSGPLNIQDLNVSGIATFSGFSDFNGDVDISGHTELDNLNVSGVSTFASNVDINSSVNISDIVIVGGGLSITGVSTFLSRLDIRSDVSVTGSTEVDEIAVLGLSTFNAAVDINSSLEVSGTLNALGSVNINGDLDVDGHTELDNLNVSGVSTFASNIDANGDLDVDGHTELDNLNVSGVATFASNVDVNSSVDISNDVIIGGNLSVSGISTFSGNIDANGDLDVDGHTELDNLNVSGISTFSGNIDANGDLDVDGHTELDDLNVSGVSTFASNIDANGDLDVDGHTELDNLNVSGVSTFLSKVNIISSVDISNDLDVSGVSTFTSDVNAKADVNITQNLDVDGHTELDDLNVSGVSTFASNIDANGDLDVDGHTELDNLNVSGVATFASNVNIQGELYGPAEFIIDPAAVGDNTGLVRIKGDLYVDGTEFIVNSSTIELADFKVGIATTVTTNLLLDGAGISIGSTEVEKSFTYNNTSNTLESSIGLGVTSGGDFKAGTDSVLNRTTLGPTVVNSSLTSVGTLNSLSVSGVSTFSSDIDANGGLDVDGHTELDTLNVSIAATISNLTLSNLGIAVTAILDEDDMISDRDDALATQQSIKAYVDSRPDPDLTFAGDVGIGTIDIDNETFTIAGTVNEIETVGIGNTLTIGLPGSIAISTSLTVASATTITGSGIIAGIITGTLDNDLTLNTAGIGLTGSATYNNSETITFTVTSNATATNSPVTIVSRDGSGDFSAGVITADLTGTATTATQLETARTFEITGDVVASPISFDGTGNVSLAATIQPNSVELGTDTFGNYVATIADSGDTDIIVNNSGTETAAITLGLTTTGVTAGSYGSGSQIPTFTVDSRGRLTAAGTSAVGTALTVSGDTGSETISLLTETLTISGGTNLTSSAAADTVTINLDDNISLTSVNATGVVTASGGFVGDLTGTATTATNLADAANITTGTISADRLTGTYNIDINGIASTATSLETARTFEITGDVVASPISFDGTGNVSLAATIQPNSVELGTDTFGDYVATIADSGDTDIVVNNSGTETAAITLGLTTTGVTAGSYGSITEIPTFTVDSRGRLTAAGTVSVGSALTVSGDSGSETIDLLTETLTISGGTNLTSSAAADTVTINLDNNISLTGVNATGVVTASGGFVGDLTGTATTATNLADAANITTGTISADRLTGTYNIDINGIASTATSLETARTFQITGDVVASPISFDGTGNVSLAATIQPNSVELGTDTFGNYVATIADSGDTDIVVNNSGTETAAITLGLTTTAVTAGSYGSGSQIPTFTVDSKGRLTAAGTAIVGIGLTVSGDSGTETVNFLTETLTISGGTNLTSSAAADTVTINLDNNISLTGVNATGVVTASGGFVGDLTGTATTATQLETERTFQITGDVVASAISFDGTGNVSLAATIQPNSVELGTDTFGDYVESISGTVGQITVTGATGEGSTPTVSIASNATLPGNVTIANDLQVNNNLNVTGNITIGGTTGYILVENFRVSDPDIILGFTTDGFGNETSNDTTANHGGIAVASTEGNPLVTLTVAGIETLPPTYKKIMWFKAGTFAGLGTDAWLSNYAVGIGSTQFPTGTRLAAGNVQITENDLAVVRNINASGVITASNFVGSLTGTASTASFATTAFTLNGVIEQDLNVSYADNAGIATNIKGGVAGNVPYQSATDTTSFVTNGSSGQVLVFNGSVPVWNDISASGAISGITIKDEGVIVGTAGSVLTLDFVGANVEASASGGISTITLSDNIVGTSLSISGISTFSGDVSIGSSITLNAATGIVSAVAFYGSGENLSDVIASKIDGIDVKEEGSLVSDEVTSINFIGDYVTASVGSTTTAANITFTTPPYATSAGIATTATQLETARTFEITGDVVASPISFDGTGNVSLAATIQPNSVELGTDTFGNYVATIADSGDTDIVVNNSGTETAAITLGLTTTGVTAGSYGSGSQIPTFTVDSRGRLTAAGTSAVGTALTVSGDTGSETISLLTETLTISGGTNLTSSAASDTVTINLDDNISLTGVNATGVVTASGGFVGDLTGTATTATQLETARTFQITGDVVASPISFDGTGNVSLAATIQPNSVELGTDTFGNYVATIADSGDTDIVVNNSGTETAAITLGLTTTGVTAGSYGSASQIPTFTVDSRGRLTAAGTSAVGTALTVSGDTGSETISLLTETLTISGGTNLTSSAASDTVTINLDPSISLTGINASGVVTASGGFVGDLTGTATTATNLADAANITTGTISADRLTGTYNISISGNAATATYADNAGVSTSVIGGIGSLTSLTVSGVSTFTSNIDANGDLDVDGHTELDNLNVSGVSTFQDNVYLGPNDSMYFGTTNPLRIFNNGSSGNQIYSSGYRLYIDSLFNDIYLRTGLNGTVDGIRVKDRAAVELYHNGNKKFETTAGGVNISGDASIGGNLSVTGITTSSEFKTGTSGQAIGINTNTISGPETITIDPAGIGDNTGLVIIKGDLQIDGTETVINSTTVTVNDKNIQIADGALNDAAADGAGITVNSGDGDKTFQFVDANDSFQANISLDVTSGNVYKINGTEVLSADTLGSGVVNSSLTSVGTLGQLNVTGVVTASSFDGNATTATALETARTIELSGDVSGSTTFDGSANVTISATIQPDSVALGNDTVGNYVATIADAGNTNITVNNSGTETAAVTLDLTNTTVSAGSYGSASQIPTFTVDSKGRLTAAGSTTVGIGITVLGDSGSETINFLTETLTISGGTNLTSSAASDTVTINLDDYISLSGINATGVVTASSFDGNATTATALETARTFQITGDVLATAISFDGSNNVSLAATIQPNSVELGTDTFGNYVATIADSGDTDIVVNNSGTETAAITLGLTTTGVTAGSYGSASQIPTFTVDSRGRLTAIGVSNVQTGAGVSLTVAGDSGTEAIDLGLETLTISGGTNLTSSAASDTVTINLDDYISLTGVNATGVVTASSFDGNASTATALQTGRTITLDGDVSGSATFDGTSNITITSTVADDSHNHTIANIDGLQGEIDAKLDAADYNASDILTKLLTVDGSGSNLDADLLDGIDSTSFLRSDTNDTATGQITFSNSIVPSVGNNTSSGINWPANPGGGSGDQASIRYYITSGENTTLEIRNNNDSADIINLVAGSVNVGGNRILTTSDEGSGNGLDADTLDGQQGSYYRNASNINAGTIADAYLPATISSDITGNSATATRLATARSISLGGDLSGSTTFDGSANVTISATIQANSVALGNDTTGNYVATIADAGNSNITVNNSGSETAAVTLDLTNTTVSAGSYGSSTQVPTFTVDSKGRLTAAGSVAVSTPTAILTVAGDSGSESINLSSETLTISGGTNLTSSASSDTVTINLDNNISVTSVSATGTISASSFSGDGSGLSGVGVTVFNDVTSNSNFYPVFTDSSTGAITTVGVSASKLTYNPSEGEITAVNFNSTSDANLKTNVKTVQDSLTIIDNLRGVSFDWKESGKASYGVIAQELEEVLPELVNQSDVKSVNYNGIIAVLIESIKELKSEIEELKKQ
jgi:hypothetical protein